MYHEIINMLAVSAPKIATALAGPGAGIVATLVANAVGAASNKPNDVMQALTSKGDDLSSILSALEAHYGDIAKQFLVTDHPSAIEINVKVSWDNMVNNQQN